jgi:WD40 repeat protein
MRAHISKLLLCLLLGYVFPLQLVVAQKPELVAQTSHYGKVGSVAFSPDSKVLATGSEDGKIKLWDVASGRELRTLTVCEASSSVVLAFSPDGHTLASGSPKNEVKLWDITSGRGLQAYTGHTDAVRAIAFSRDGALLASASNDQTIKLWDLRKPGEPRTFTGHTSGITSLAFSPDGTKLASGAYDQMTKLWDVASGRDLWTLPEHVSEKGFDIHVAFSPDGTTLVSAGYSGLVQLWDIASQKKIKTFSNLIPVLALAYSPDGKAVASAEMGDVKLFDVATGKSRSFTLKTDTIPIEAIAISPDGLKLAAAASNAVKLWDVPSGNVLRIVHGDTLPYTSIALTADWRILAAGRGSDIALWDLAEGRGLRSLEADGDISALATSQDGLAARVGSIGTGYSLLLWNSQTSTTLDRFTDYPTSVAFSPDGQMLASGAGYRTKGVGLWDLKSGQVRLLEGHTQNVASVAFSPDGRTLASGAWDNTIKLWDVARGTEKVELTGHKNPVFHVAFSPTEPKLASSDGETLKLWDLTTYKPLQELDHGSTIAFSPNGRTLAVADYEKKIELWDVDAWHKTQTFEGGTDATSMFFSAEGNSLAAIGADGTVTFWNLATGRQLATFFPGDNGDWAVLDPEGRFDASPGGMNLMHWVVGLEPIDLTQLKERYYEPGLLAKVLAYNKEPLHPVIAFQDVKLFPEVSVEPLAPGSTKLKVKLVNRGGGFGRVQVFVNGQELLADARGDNLNSTSAEATLTADLAGAPIKPGESNEVRVVAWNSEGYLSSGGGVKVTYKAQGTKDQNPPELYAIVSGISEYSSGDIHLRFAAKDAENFAHALRIGGDRLFGAGHVHLTLLTSPASSGQQAATKANLAGAFEAAAKARPGDVFVVYLAGHGVAIRDGYAYPTSEARTLDLNDPAVLNDSAVSDEELAQWIRKVHALHRAMILDTCAAGAIAKRLMEKRDVSGDQTRAMDRLKDRTGFYVLMGSAADAASYETSQYGEGLLTYALLKGMKGPALREDKFVDVALLFHEVTDDVPELAKGIGGIQQPRLLMPVLEGCATDAECKGEASFDIGELSNEDRNAIPLATRKPFLSRPIFINTKLHRDNLHLIDALRNRLRDESYASSAGALKIAYVDEDDFSGAISPTGDYSIEGDRVSVTVVLSRDGQEVSHYTIQGSVDNLEVLCNSIVAELKRALQP